MSLFVLFQHNCHRISVTLMENVRDALLDILCFLYSPLLPDHPDTVSDTSMCETVHVLCIWASVTAQITAQCTSEHSVFKCQLSGRRAVTVLSEICCPCDTMCLKPHCNQVSCTSNKMILAEFIIFDD